MKSLLLASTVRSIPMCHLTFSFIFSDAVTLQQLSSYVANFEKKPLKVDTNASPTTSSLGAKKAVGY